jgi:hypothetical protein
MDAKGVEGLEHEWGEKARKGWIVWSTKGAKRAKGVEHERGEGVGGRKVWITRDAEVAKGAKGFGVWEGWITRGGVGGRREGLAPWPTLAGWWGWTSETRRQQPA